MRTVRGCILAMIGAAMVSSMVLADVVTLRSSAVIDADAPILLADIARLQGDDAVALGDIMLTERAESLAGPRSWFEIDLDTVRKALQERGVNWGRIALGGSSCAVRLVMAPEASEDDQKPKQTANAEPGAVDLSGPPTIRRRIERMLASLYDVEPERLRLLFRPADQEFLSQSEWIGRIEAQPQASSRSGAMPVRVRIYRGERVVTDRVVRVEAQVRTDVVTVVMAIRRGQTLTADRVRVETKWLDPATPTITSLEKVIGKKTATRLAAGAVLRPEQIESPVMIQRGELVNVRCLSGAVAITTRARAKRDARDGEMVELQLEGSAKTFLARVDGRGRAVVDLDMRTNNRTDSSVHGVGAPLEEGS